MKSRLLAAVAIGAVFLVAPASAQVKIGILNDQSRVYADSGGKYSLEAARMAVEDFGGEVLGQKIEIATADHQNKPDLATAIARRWYDTEGVDMITELTTSSVALAVQELSKEKKKIDIVVGAATSRITGDACTPYSFHWAYDTRALAVGTGGALVESGGDTWFFLTADYAFGYALEKATRDIVTSKGGKVLGSVRVPLNSSDFSSFLLQAQCRHLFGDLELSEGGEGRRQQGHRGGYEEAEGAAGRRRLCARQGAGERPHGARHLSVRGQEAVRVEEAVGLLQADRRRPRRQGVLHGEGKRLPADEIGIPLIIPTIARPQCRKRQRQQAH